MQTSDNLFTGIHIFLLHSPPLPCTSRTPASPVPTHQAQAPLHEPHVLLHLRHTLLSPLLQPTPDALSIRPNYSTVSPSSQPRSHFTHGTQYARLQIGVLRGEQRVIPGLLVDHACVRPPIIPHFWHTGLLGTIYIYTCRLCSDAEFMCSVWQRYDALALTLTLNCQAR